MTLRTCENCERTIGHMEADFTWQDRRVCRECHGRLSGELPQPAAGGAATVVRPPSKPWVFWLAMLLFVVGAVLVGVEAMNQVGSTIGSAQSPEELLRRLSESQTGSAAADTTLTVLSLVLCVAHIVGFVKAWAGHLWGAVLMVATAVALTALEFAGGSLLGLKPTPLYLAAGAAACAGFGCFFLPPALAYYRRATEYRIALRRGESQHDGMSG